MLGSDQAALELRGALAVAEPGRPRAQRRAVSEARQAAKEAQSAADAARSAWIPKLELNGGLRIGEIDETHYGYVAGVSLEVPLFSRGQELGAEARARESVAEARAAALEHRASLDELSARHELASALAEVERLRGAASERVEKVLRAAESSYREGTRSLLELLDAQTMATEIALRRLDAELRAKRAELKLRAARGDFE
jgi:outer membrane protein, heavy metal efflux system